MFVIIYEEWTPCVVDATEADGVNGLPVPPTDWLGWISSSESASLHRHGEKSVSKPTVLQYCSTRYNIFTDGNNSKASVAC